MTFLILIEPYINFLKFNDDYVKGTGKEENKYRNQVVLKNLNNNDDYRIREVIKR